MTVRQRIIHSVGGKIALAKGEKYRNTGESNVDTDRIIMDALESIETVIAGADEYLDKAESSRIAWQRLKNAINKRANEVFDYIKHNADREQATETTEQATPDETATETAVSAVIDEHATETPQHAIQTTAERNTDNRAVLMPESWQASASKSVRSRLEQFCYYLDTSGRAWFQPDLAAYRDELLKTGKSAATASAYLSTVRSRYKVILLDNDLFYSLVPDAYTSPADRKAYADEIKSRIQNAINPLAAKVEKKTKHKDSSGKSVDTHTRLTMQQVRELLDNMPSTTPAQKRNRAIMALLLTTGIRVDELVNLRVSDLDNRFPDGSRYLLVRAGKGNKQRYVLWGSLHGTLSKYVMPWLQSLATFYRSNIRPSSQDGLLADDYIFVPLAKGGKHTLNGGKYDAYENRETTEGLNMSTRAVQKLFKKLPLPEGVQSLTPHDCRRTYARLLYVAGVKLKDIKDALGHQDMKTTDAYIGILETSGGPSGLNV